MNYQDIDADQPSRDSSNEPSKGTLFSDFQESIAGFQFDPNYCCGGSFAVKDPQELKGPSLDLTSNRPLWHPITVRFDGCINKKKTLKVRFPHPAASESGDARLDNESAFSQLVKSCLLPNSNESGGCHSRLEGEVGMLHSGHFSVDSHPHDMGIVDAIAQVLLPERRFDSRWDMEQLENCRIEARLFNLMIFSSTNRTIKFRGDYPQNGRHFGNLVVCLPQSHQGGALEIRHGGRTTVFDWANKSNDSIQWAAFYSDCEREVLPVTFGHQVTLNYALTISKKLQWPAVEPELFKCLTFEPELSPLYRNAERLIKHPEFLKKSGKLGFYCTHTYPHTSKRASVLLPSSLKGLDMTIYTIFCRLGLIVNIKPVLRPHTQFLNEIEKEIKEGYADKSDCVGTLPTGSFDRVGRSLHPLKVVEAGKCDQDWKEKQKELSENWEHDCHRDITWINQPSIEPETALVHPWGAIGDHSFVVAHKSFLALIISAPHYFY